MSKRVRAAIAMLGTLSALAIVPAASAQSQTSAGDLVARYDRSADPSDAVPQILSAEEREHFRGVFNAIDREQWEQAAALLARGQESVLHQVAAAEYYTHANSPKVSAGQVADWFEDGTDLPQAQQLSRIGANRGLEATPTLPRPQSFARQPSAPKRILPRRVNDGSISDSTRQAILDRIKNDDPAGAHAVLAEVDPYLSSEARAEWRQRVAWSYYIENDDAGALALARTVGEGSGAWVAEGEWVAGLAAWRLGLCDQAGEAFERSAYSAVNVELAAAGYYWAHRAQLRCREPQKAQTFLSAAAQYDETLYGMLAIDQLGIDVAAEAPARGFDRGDWNQISDRTNVRVAKALTEIGRPALADEVLRHEARIGRPQDYAALARLARELGLPSTQLFMAQYAPYGMQADRSLRFPVARWQPTTGWRVDPALAFAHALQESNFRARAVSPANARGLMQITPITVRQHAPRLNMSASYVNLDDPEVNLAFGQRNLEMLRDNPATQGHLPKIMAAYNAGLTPVERWNYEINDQGDPLLWMESIPYWETRGYVAIVMRNYWMYERAAGVESPSRRALAQGQWPTFPQAYRSRSAHLSQ